MNPINLINLFLQLGWNYSVYRSMSDSEAESIKEALSKKFCLAEPTVRFKLELFGDAEPPISLSFKYYVGVDTDIVMWLNPAELNLTDTKPRLFLSFFEFLTMVDHSLMAFGHFEEERQLVRQSLQEGRKTALTPSLPPELEPMTHSLDLV